jgi:hypothetical protein
MSTNAAVAAAQRRRAGTKSESSSSSNVKFDDPRGPDMGGARTLGLSDVLGIQSRQLRFLKDYQEGNERHWEANDEFLHQLSEKVDELSEAQNDEQATKGKDELVTSVMSRVTTLEKEMTQLHGIVASLQDELLQKESN